MAPATDSTDLVLLEEVAEHVWRATLNSPADLNALSGAMRTAILNAQATARENGATVLILSGDDRAFSSGYKLDPGVMRPKTAVEDRARLVEVTDFMSAFRDSPVVTITEIRGYCLAGGTDLMLASDLAFAANDAALGVPNVRGVGITLLLPLWSWLLGPQRAKLLALTGDTIRGDEAADLGLVTGAYESDVLAEKVLAVAQRIAQVPHELTAVTKHALNTAWDNAGYRSTVARAAELDALSHATDPVVEFWDNVVENGMKAALTERDAPFRTGRVLDVI
ncbi:enoyl-CoA hydratase-related protein [Gordonia hydrophobica]|uniref:Enoyl-CoA hydratase-related protein n=1 Tax=Gordonia hydrophobica TaxID=40516 RepID=A0ABZ2U6C6_9ACTN|nr:enoyl-CoA hydratase-related protein [Gordonia hydrophobica]MBM7365403.1 enoyl-CoA hydratase [Gordonia hydrophobica]